MFKIFEGKLIIFSFFIAIFGLFVFSLAAQAQVTDVVSSTIATTTTEEATSSPWDEAPAVVEPTIRVGIYKTDKKVLFMSPYSYEVISNEQSLGLVEEGKLVTLSYDNGVYSIVTDSFSTTSIYFIRLISHDADSYFSIMNLDRHLIGRSQLNFATFRGDLEYRYAPKSEIPYVINELLLENYVAGIAETSNGAPDEYIKALQIAARTYAYMNIGPAPSEKRMFDVYASTVDQLYLGYNFEQFSPRIALFTAATRGQMVTYRDKPVTTYYYSRSNGKTKTKPGVPWLKSVACKYDKGWRQLGHGYGMSNRDAAARARIDKWKYEKILNYYYSGTKVQKLYE
ncbi:MAG: SpoIID/LytB domain-containing protein [Patescibacteria group bacterium]|jgi:peptidoglycan hydrolase-like amidase